MNGTFGRVKTVRYKSGSDGKRHATSCVLETTTYAGPVLPNLRQSELAIMPDSVDIKFTHPHSKKSSTIKRKQLPILPALAMTVHKAQGLTLDKAIVDLASCRGTESAYVMLSRVRRLEDLVVLRPFSKEKITCRPSEDIRREFKRLSRLQSATMAKYFGGDGPAGDPATVANIDEMEISEKTDVARLLTSYDKKL